MKKVLAKAAARQEEHLTCSDNATGIGSLNNTHTEVNLAGKYQHKLQLYHMTVK